MMLRRCATPFAAFASDTKIKCSGTGDSASGAMCTTAPSDMKAALSAVNERSSDVESLPSQGSTSSGSLRIALDRSTARMPFASSDRVDSDAS